MTATTSAGGGSQCFPRAYRLRKRCQYLDLQRQGKRRAEQHFVVITRRREGGPSRIGITTSKRVGHAPARNRVRRLVREFFRRHRTALAEPQDIVVIARRGAVRLTYDDVVRELARALGIATR